MPPNPNSVGVLIPARFGSSRFPGKPLALLAGRPLIQHAYEAATQVPNVSEVRVVTDDARIAHTVEQFGGQVMIIDTPCRTGTDRVAKAAAQLDCSIIVNLQADEIPLHPSLLRDLIDPFLDSNQPMGTLKRELSTADELQDTALVKVVTDIHQHAIYFSRLPIPFVRDGQAGDASTRYYGHLGIYIFQRETLLHFADLPTGVLEDAEKLEQLRALEHGIAIRVWETKHKSLRIDRPEELKAAEAQFIRQTSQSHSCPPTSVYTASTQQ
ncbi:MAG: 3-deoxy-manno-octulosonate cytidylyltransferase [Nitrospirales bacterium]|nr:MAG: 3-deoxy-manno-octulosonate cytidylyltransferase [Nitrospirales bacterium]